jgi:hypothetical protein
MGRECETHRRERECIQDFGGVSWRKNIDEDVQIILK